MAHAQFWDHVVQSALPTLKVCMLGAVGVVLARAGILDSHGRRTLSRLIYFVFTPCLTFAKLAPVLSVQHLLSWMPLALNMFVSVAVGLLLGVLLVLLVKPPAGFNKHVIVTTGLGNAGNLPLVLVSALMRGSGGTLFAGQAVSMDLAIAYVAMGIWAATVTHFTVGTYMLKLPGGAKPGLELGSSSSTPAAAAAAASGGKHDEQLPLIVTDTQQQHPHKSGHRGIELSSATGQLPPGGFYLSARYNHSAHSSPICSSCGVAEAAVQATQGCGGQRCSSCGYQHIALPQGQFQQEEEAAAGISEHAAAATAAAAAGLAAKHPMPLQHQPFGPYQHQQHQQHQQQQQQQYGSIFAPPTASMERYAPLRAGLSDQLPPGHQHERQQEQQQQRSADSPVGEQDSLLGPASQRVLSSSSDDASWVQVDLRQPLEQQHSKQRLPGIQQQQQHHWLSRSCLAALGSRLHGSCSRMGSSSGRSGAAAVGNVLVGLASPPMIGCMMGVAIGVLPLIRNELFAPGGHLLMVQDCISMFGDCCIPSLMLMLGATLAKGPGRCCPPLRVVVGVTAARLVVLPVLGTGWLLLASRAGWLAAPDSIFWLVMLIQNSVPTALNVHTLATLNSNREEEVGALLFWQYLAACFTVPACLMLFTWLLKTGALAVAA